MLQYQNVLFTAIRRRNILDSWTKTLKSKLSSSANEKCKNPSKDHDIQSFQIQLHNRSVVQVSGTDASNYLQGLITNDMRHFEDGHTGSKSKSIYAMLLNHQGRVLYDTIIYATMKDGTVSFLLECDTVAVDDFCHHLKTYKIRKKIDVVTMGSECKVWAVFPNLDTMHKANLHTTDFDPVASQIQTDFAIDDKVCALTRDPRLATLGWRMILSCNVTPQVVLQKSTLQTADKDSYSILKYRLGIGEGVSDLPPGNCLPLECNADYLHGVSFHKGCYIGQELTARTHHTGIVRKRLLPLVLDKPLHGEGSSWAIISKSDGKNIGKLRGHCNHYGLALLRLQDCFDSRVKLLVKGSLASISADVQKPFWWPLEAPKDIIPSPTD